MMTLQEYQELAYRTALKERSLRDMIVTSALGIAGEAGEVADIVKKHFGHGHPLDDDKLIKELGDVLWYVADLCSNLGYSLDFVARMNIDKLRARYPEGFSTERSLNRKDNE